jgi:hypothetical protein
MTNTDTSLVARYADQFTPELRPFFPPLTFLETEDHRRLIHDLRDQAEAWLRMQGIDQFTASAASKSAHAHDDIDRLFDAGQFAGLSENGDIKAVVAITDPDPDFWTPSEVAEPQGYLSRLLVAEHGRFYGQRLLFAVQAAEIRLGSRWLRLDCWRTNAKLHAYYLARGFVRVRTAVVPGRMSGELFQYDLHRRSDVSSLDHDARKI